MRNYLLIVAAIALLTGCKPKKCDTVTVTGNVLSGGDKVYFMHMKSSSLDNVGETYEAPIDTNGYFSIEIPVTAYTTGLINAGNYYHDFVISPTDHISLTINGDSIIYTGAGANKNTLNNLVQINNLGVNRAFMEMFSGKHTPESFVFFMGKYKFQRDSIINTFTATNSVDSNYINGYNSETQIMYCYALYRFPYVYIEQTGKTIEELALSEAYKYHTIYDLTSDEYIHNGFYVNIIMGAIHDAAYAKSMNDTLKTIDDYKLELIMNIPGLTREYIMAKFINNKIAFDQIVDSTVVASFKMLNPTTETMDYVDNSIAKYVKKQSYIGAILPDNVLALELEDTVGNKLTFGQLLDNNKGNVIYLDMWSLGCVPCRFAMPYSNQLKDELRGKSISFVYITVDKKRENLWGEVVKASMTDKNHYRFVDNMQSDLHKLFEIYWVPNYMIFDKSGKLVSYSAERPVNFETETLNNKLKEQLLELL